jgi:hypothetical protein
MMDEASFAKEQASYVEQEMKNLNCCIYDRF